MASTALLEYFVKSNIYTVMNTTGLQMLQWQGIFHTAFSQMHLCEVEPYNVSIVCHNGGTPQQSDIIMQTSELFNPENSRFTVAYYPLPSC